MVRKKSCLLNFEFLTPNRTRWTIMQHVVYIDRQMASMYGKGHTQGLYYNRPVSRRCVSQSCLWRCCTICCFIAFIVNLYFSKSLLGLRLSSPKKKPDSPPSRSQFLKYLTKFDEDLDALSINHRIRSVNLTRPYGHALALYGASGRLYKEFGLDAPGFPTSTFIIKELFWKNTQNVRDLYYPGVVSRRGVVAVIPNGVFTESSTCNTNSTLPQYLQTPPGANMAHRAYVLPLNDAQTKCRMRTLVTDFLPRLAQAQEFLNLTDLTVIIHGYCDLMVGNILKSLGLKINFYPNDEKVFGYVAKYQINSCIVPRMHPVLLKVAQKMLNVETDPKKSKRYSQVALLLRMSKATRGRTISNSALVKSILEDRFQEVITFEGSRSLLELRWVFERSKIFIAVHGPILYNIIFAPPNSQIVEIFATRSDGSYITDFGAKNVNDIWRLSQSLGHRYYRMLEAPDGNLGGVVVNPQEFEYMVDTLMSVDDI